MHKSRFVHHILCESPFISRDFYAIRPLILWHVLGAYFLLIWWVGVSKCFSVRASTLEPKVGFEFWEPRRLDSN